jgi:hypothetical protein
MICPGCFHHSGTVQVSMLRCPRCQSAHVHRSRLRLYERPFKLVTSRRPHRCHDCGWRGWGVHEPLEEYAFRGDRPTDQEPLGADADVDLRTLDDDSSKP